MKHEMGTGVTYGFCRIRGFQDSVAHLWGPNTKDCSKLGSRMGSPDSGKLPFKG